ncbi:MAG: Nif3-like dinuclear metal center hexameric protein [Bacillota bacterium]
MIRVLDVIRTIEEKAPLYLAEEWDNSGLLVGDSRQEVTSVLISLDLTRDTVAEAMERGANLIITHHPAILRPVSRLNWDREPDATLCSVIRNGLSVYTAHTNLDRAREGTADALLSALGMTGKKVFAGQFSPPLYKFVVFVPKGHEDAVRQALGDAGAGFIGDYSHCTFMTQGQGSFCPLEGAKPYIGEVNRLEIVDEYRVETIVRKADVAKVLRAVFRVHPYEEVAFDLYPLENTEDGHGFGRIARLNEPVTLLDMAKRVKEALRTGVRLVGPGCMKVLSVAVIPGSGGSFITQASREGADILITGDVKYHEAQEALSRGLGIIDAGHFATERPVLRTLGRWINASFADIPVHISQRQADVFAFSQ